MGGNHSKQKEERVKAAVSIAFILLFTSSFFTLSCQKSRSRNINEIRILIENPPATLEPRNALDANGQRLNMLLFRGITTLDPELEVQGDLASRWWTEKSGKRWVFEVAPGAVSAEALAACVRGYLEVQPPSPLKGSFPGLKQVSSEGNRLLIDLEEPDPFFPRNASLFRYYQEKGVTGHCLPVQEPANVQASGDYEMRPFQKSPEREIRLHPRRDPSAPVLHFEVTRDETSRLQRLLIGEADVAQNSFSATKYAWLREKESGSLEFLSRDGVNVSYLAFQINDPLLGQTKVRKAIAAAIDREKIVRYKMPGITSLAGSFLSPRLPGSVQSPGVFDPVLSERLLDEAGLKRGKDGIRFTLGYKTTPQKDGFETALLIQNMLAKTGIRLELDVVEPAVFFASIRKGNFQLYSSRWVGVSDASILHRTLSSESADNRLKYHSLEMDAWLSKMQRELDTEKRNILVQRIQKKMAEDVPYYPLWFWTNLLVMRKGLVGLQPEDLSLSGSFVPLTRLRWQTEKNSL